MKSLFPIGTFSVALALPATAFVQDNAAPPVPQKGAAPPRAARNAAAVRRARRRYRELRHGARRRLGVEVIANVALLRESLSAA
jgi:hypothetical protein